MLGCKHGFSVRAASEPAETKLLTESQVLILCGEDFTEQGASYPRLEGWMTLCPEDKAEGQSRQKQKEKHVLCVRKLHKALYCWDIKSASMMEEGVSQIPL